MPASEGDKKKQGLPSLSMNRPTPNPSQEGNRHRSVSCPFPSWEGLGVGSWSQCMRRSERRLSMNAPSPLDLSPAQSGGEGGRFVHRSLGEGGRPGEGKAGVHGPNACAKAIGGSL